MLKRLWERFKNFGENTEVFRFFGYKITFLRAYIEPSYSEEYRENMKMINDVYPRFGFTYWYWIPKFIFNIPTIDFDERQEASLVIKQKIIFLCYLIEITRKVVETNIEMDNCCHCDCNCCHCDCDNSNCG